MPTGGELIGADGVAVGADLGVVEDEVHQQERQTREDDIAGRAGEETQLRGQRLLDAARDEDRDTFKNQHQTDRDDHGRDIQVVVQHADQKADKSTASEAAEDEAGVTELLRQNDADDGGQDDVRADSEVKQAHHDDEIEPAAADGVDDGGLEIGVEIGEGAEVRGGQDLKDPVEKNEHRAQQDQAVVPAGFELCNRV